MSHKAKRGKPEIVARNGKPVTVVPDTGEYGSLLEHLEELDVSLQSTLHDARRRSVHLKNDGEELQKLLD